MTYSSHPRILQVFGRLNRGGAEMRTVDLLRYLPPASGRIDFCSLSADPGDLDSEVRALGARLYRCPLNPTFPQAFVRLLRAGAYDGVHVHLNLFSGCVLRLAAHAGVPLRIVHFRSTHSGRVRSLRRTVQNRLMRRWIDRQATHILGNAESSLTWGWSWRWREDPRCLMIPNGLDTTAFHRPVRAADVRGQFGWSEDCRVLMHVGRMEPVKNHQRVIRIAERVMAADPSVRLLLVGRQSPLIKPMLVDRLAESGFTDRVVFAGLRTDVAQLLQAADVLLFPSRYEGLPGAVLEACAAGVPIIASDLPGIREVAGRLAGIHCLSQALSDEHWADAVRHSLASPPSRASRLLSLREFEQSVFHVGRALQMVQQVWSGVPAQQIRPVSSMAA